MATADSHVNTTHHLPHSGGIMGDWFVPFGHSAPCPEHNDGSDGDEWEYPPEQVNSKSAKKNAAAAAAAAAEPDDKLEEGAAAHEAEADSASDDENGETEFCEDGGEYEECEEGDEEGAEENGGGEEDGEEGEYEEEEEEEEGEEGLLYSDSLSGEDVPSPSPSPTCFGFMTPTPSPSPSPTPSPRSRSPLSFQASPSPSPRTKSRSPSPSPTKSPSPPPNRSLSPQSKSVSLPIIQPTGGLTGSGPNSPKILPKQPQAQQTAPPALDPATPTREQVVQHLSHKIVGRPDRENLIDLNILKPSHLSPALQATASALERGRTAIRLEKKISGRPGKEELVNHNILKDINVAGRLQPAMHEVLKAKRKQSMEHKIEKRPSFTDITGRSTILTVTGDRENVVNALLPKIGQRPEPDQLRAQHILQDDGKIAPRLQTTATTIQHELRKSSLSHAVKNRQPKDNLIAHNIIKEGSPETNFSAQLQKRKADVSKTVKTGTRPQHTPTHSHTPTAHVKPTLPPVPTSPPQTPESHSVP
ncbi:MKL/myocardin-like protein [Pelomyxa schiedti]|nr:MKL/myocardin-like protein [Pelomyxa schiedti]